MSLPAVDSTGTFTLRLSCPDQVLELSYVLTELEMHAANKKDCISESPLQTQGSRRILQSNFVLQ